MSRQFQHQVAEPDSRIVGADLDPQQHDLVRADRRRLSPEGEALGKVITTQVIKSALALPWPAELPPGLHRVRGYAQSPTGPITRVEWSVDSGQTWSDSTVHEPQVQYSWARFEFMWDAEPGEHVVMTRATDAAGNTQPDEIPFNEKGYLFNQPVPHPVRVKYRAAARRGY